jgi:uncharacterized protein YaaN involved in tellurite resistance
MSSAAASVIPRPAAEQVSALRASLDPHQPDAFATFGQEALAALVAACAPLTTAPDASLDQAARATLGQAGATVSALNPQGLVPRRGLTGLFDSRGGRLKQVRKAFQDTDRQLTRLADELKSQASALTDRAGRLDPAQDALRQPIIDLGGWIEAGRQRLADVATVAPEGGASPHTQLAQRLEALASARVAALAQLPMARQMQNADAAAVAGLQGAAEAIAAWREGWRKGLGLDGKRPRKVQPQPADLAGLSARLQQSLDRAGRILNDGTRRRDQATGRLAALRSSLVGPTDE